MIQGDKLIKRLAIILLIVCVIFLGIDVFKILKINIDFMGMQSTTRVSNSSDISEIRYEPTDYVISNKDEAIEEIKELVIQLKNEYKASNKKIDVTEIANVHKLENYFYEYKSYAVVKYKLMNIIEDLPKLSKKLQGNTNEQLKSYFNNNKASIEKMYGITSSDEFVQLAKSLSSNIKMMIVQTNTIQFDYDNDRLNFDVKVKADNDKFYSVDVQYYKTSDNQVTPYLKFVVR